MNAVLPITAPTKVTTQVTRHLLALINAGHLRPGDGLPSELQVVRDLAVSRGSVREAYRTLASLGILEIENGRRPRLKPIDPTVLCQVFDYALTTAQVDVAHVLETRRAIEMQTAQLAARHATPAQCRELLDLVAEMRSAGSDHARRVASDMAIHALIAEASGNPLNGLLLHALHAPLEASSRLHFDEHRSVVELTRVIDAHELVVDRIVAGDPVGAASAMSCHFDLSMVRVRRRQAAATTHAASR